MTLKKTQFRTKKTPSGHTHAFRKSDGKQVCGAQKAKQPGIYCQQTGGLAENGRCRHHGAKSGRPKTVGLWDRAFGRHADAFRAAREDPELLDLERVLAGLNMEVVRCIERLEDHDTPEWRQELLQLSELSRGDEEGAEKAGEKLHALIASGCESDDAHARFRQQIDRLGQRLEKVWGVKLAQKNAVSATDLASILGHFLDFVRLEAGEQAAVGVERRMSREMERKPRPSRVGLN